MREFKSLGIVMAVLSLAAPAAAEPGEVIEATPADAAPQPATFDDHAPDLDWVWVDGHDLEDGTVVEGFYRVRSRNDFAWVDGAVSGGAWVAPRWRPNADAAAGKVYVRGHRGANGYWAQGHWRRAERDGFTWTATATGDDGTAGGHWVPANKKKGLAWVPGHWTADGWVDGFWRRLTWPARKWVAGAWRYGVYHRGHWAPSETREGQAWIPGHQARRGWQVGHWRPLKKSGAYWQAGRWSAGGWTSGRWVEGRRAGVARRYRVVHASDMQRRRAAKRVIWRASPAGVDAVKKRIKVRGKRGKRSRKKRPRKAW